MNGGNGGRAGVVGAAMISSPGIDSFGDSLNSRYRQGDVVGGHVEGAMAAIELIDILYQSDREYNPAYVAKSVQSDRRLAIAGITLLWLRRRVDWRDSPSQLERSDNLKGRRDCADRSTRSPGVWIAGPPHPLR